MYLSNSVLYINRALAYRECPERTEDDYTIECHIPAQNNDLRDMFEPASDYTMNLTLTSSIGEVSQIYHIPVAQNGTATKNIHYNNYEIYENRSTLYISPAIYLGLTNMPGLALDISKVLAIIKLKLV